MKDYAKSFYKSKAWQHCRDAYAKSQAGLCERCLKEGKIVPGEIVHYSIPGVYKVKARAVRNLARVLNG